MTDLLISEPRTERPRPPARPPTQSVVQIAAIGFIAYVVATLLNAASLHANAERLPLGAQRDNALAAADIAVDVSERVGFDRPADALRWIRGVESAGTTRPATASVSVPVSTTTAPIAVATSSAATSSVATSTPAPIAPAPATTTTTAVVTFPDVPRPAPLGPAAPLRAWFGGDSLAQGLGLAFERWVDGEQFAQLDGKGVISTGLARPDVYDWARDIALALESGAHDVLFVLLGANDAQPLRDDRGAVIEFGSAEWVADYRLRVAALMAQADAAQTRLVWIGLPPARTDVLDAKLSVITAAVAAEAKLHAAVAYVDLRTALAPNGQYDAYCTRPDEHPFLCRTNDGVHFTPDGYRYVAELAVTAARAS